MSSTTPTAAKGSRGRKGKGAKKPFWQMELGRKKGGDLTEEEVEHPPFVAALPRVNLLPAAIRRSAAMRKVRRSLIALVAVLVVAVGALWYLQGSRITDAEARLVVAQGEARALQAQMEALAPITTLASALESQKAVVEATLASQPQSSLVIQRLAEAGRTAAGNRDITFSNVAVTYRGIPVAGGVLNACPNPNPFGTEPTMGCVTFNASLADRQAVSRLLEVLESDPMFVGPYVTSTSVSVDENGVAGVTFAGTAGVSLDALESPLTPEQIEAIVNPPKPADTEKADTKKADTKKESESP